MLYSCLHKVRHCSCKPGLHLACTALQAFLLACKLTGFIGLGGLQQMHIG